MKKIISLSITLFCFTFFIQSCEPEKSPTPKPTLTAVIYSEKLISSSGQMFCERLVCISPETASNLPLTFTNSHKDGNAACLTILGLKFNNGDYIEITLPENAAELKPEKLPVAFGEALHLGPITPFKLKNVKLKSAPWEVTSNKLS